MMPGKNRVDLNSIEIPWSACCEPGELERYSSGAIAMDGRTEVRILAHFENIKHHLMQFIGRHDCILGCVAWMTDFEILHALQTRRSVAIVVQKEDFLRPDLGSPHDRGWTERLRAEYAKLPSGFSRDDFQAVLVATSSQNDGDIEAVRCMGVINGERTKPNMHHKFLVGGHRHNIAGYFIGDAVWTGSFNFTLNSSLSRENVIETNAANIVDCFAHEWEMVAALSEPLDWTSAAVCPEWRAPE